MKLYKYVSLERIDILENSLLRFTQPSTFNDPFEMKPIFGSFMQDETEYEELASGLEVVREQYDELPDDVREQVSYVEFVKAS